VEWPLEARVFAVCASAAAITIVISHGYVIFVLTAAIMLVIYGLVG
jgi:hypothetical protein